MRTAKAAVLCCLGVLLATTQLPISPASAAPGRYPGPASGDFDPASDSEGNHCFAPGGDANEILGVSEAIVFSPPGCTEVDAGEFYIAINPWITNTHFEVMPDGFLPAGPTPMDDFVAKLETVTFVVDPQTRMERAFVYPAEAIIKVDTYNEFVPWFPPYPIAHLLGKLPPLPRGEHKVDTYLNLASLHCDGFGTEPELNCLSAGKHKLELQSEFMVLSGGP